MLSIAIYSDNQADTQALRSLIQDFLIETKTLARVSVFNNKDEFIVVPASFDIYIMDMDSQDDVIEIGKQMMDIDPGMNFIYISKDTSVAYKAAKIHADYFLSKPVEQEELFTVLHKIKKEVREDSIILKSAEGERRIRVSNLNYINIVKRCLCYHLKDGNMFDGQTLRTSFEKAINPLQDHEAFLFLAPSLLINISEVKEVCADHLYFENDEVLYFPKKAYDTVRECWLTYNRIL